MRKDGPQERINRIIDYLIANPTVLDKSLTESSIKVVFSERKKRFTEFHRIMVQNHITANKPVRYYWIRIVKNKPAMEIKEALNKQFHVMCKIYTFFGARQHDQLNLGCCKAITVLPDFSSLITRECSGQLFNDYLRKCIPQMSENKLLRHCFNCGVWLRNFHECFKIDTVDHNEYKSYLGQYKEKYGKEPATEVRYITYCHNDFTPRNIFVKHNSVEVIDYVGTRLGLPEQDISVFTQYILNARFNLLYPLRVKKEMINAFRQGYKGGLTKLSSVDLK